MNTPILPLAVLAAAWALPCQSLRGNPPAVVEIPGPIADGAPSEPAPKPAPIDFTVLESRTRRMHVSHAPEMPGLPPVAGTVNVTVQMVEDPDLPAPPPPLPALPPDDPAVLARIEEYRENHRGTDLIYISAQVFDHARTLITVYPNGGGEDAVTACSNLDFNHFSGVGMYRVKEADGSFRDFCVLMGIDNTDTARLKARLARHGREYQAPDLPHLSDRAVAGPDYVVVSGDANGSAAGILENLHRLSRKEGARMEAAFHAREEARAARRAHLLAHPPQPQDVTIRFWKRNRPAAQGQAVTEGEGGEP